MLAPKLHTAKGIKHTARGLRPKGLEGLIVHFDAYRIRAAGNGAENSDARSLDTLKSGQINGYHYLEISRTGKIFASEGFSWMEWGYHAGQSLCPVTQRPSVSIYYVGVEMNNPGLLFPTEDPDIFCPWYNSVRDSRGNPVMDSKGRVKMLKAFDEHYTKAEVRHVKAKDNIKSGYYLPYSHAQFEALVNLCLFLSKTQKNFKLSQVLGHDEVAPNRKNDPGGALANPDEVMTMPEFRDYLKQRAG